MIKHERQQTRASLLSSRTLHSHDYDACLSWRLVVRAFCPSCRIALHLLGIAVTVEEAVLLAFGADLAHLRRSVQIRSSDSEVQSQIHSNLTGSVCLKGACAHLVGTLVDYMLVSEYRRTSDVVDS